MSTLGPIETWPPVLRSTIGLMLRSAFPEALVWGSDMITFHNDAFMPILGSKPAAIGVPFYIVWAEAWDDIGPIAAKALAGEATFIENFPLVINRAGDAEQAYFTFCYSPVVDADGQIQGFMDTVVETTETVLAQQRADVINAELSHRIRNIIALVSSIASQTVRASEDREDIERTLSRRLQALADVQNVLRSGDTIEAEIHGIVSTALAPHVIKEGRVLAQGPNLKLPEKKALALSLALNELMTNAIKYGALSNEEGQVAISWQAADNNGLYLTWRERGGPAVTPPVRSGFGSRLIQRHVAAAFGATARINFDPEGVVYEILPSED